MNFDYPHKIGFSIICGAKARRALFGLRQAHGLVDVESQESQVPCARPCLIKCLIPWKKIVWMAFYLSKVKHYLENYPTQKSDWIKTLIIDLKKKIK